MWHLLYSEDPSVSPPVLSIFMVFCADECVRLQALSVVCLAKWCSF